MARDLEVDKLEPENVFAFTMLMLQDLLIDPDSDDGRFLLRATEYEALHLQRDDNLWSAFIKAFENRVKGNDIQGRSRDLKQQRTFMSRQAGSIYDLPPEPYVELADQYGYTQITVVDPDRIGILRLREYTGFLPGLNDADACRYILIGNAPQPGEPPAKVWAGAFGEYENRVLRATQVTEISLVGTADVSTTGPWYIIRPSERRPS